MSVRDTVQIGLDGTETLAAAVHLTARQRHALDTIARMQPVASDELGAELCAARGKHPADQRCQWDSKNGREVATALRRKGLVRFRRRSDGWTLTDYRPGDHLPSAEPREGFDDSGFPETY